MDNTNIKNYIPSEIIEYIKSFLKTCTHCYKTETSNNTRTCVFCKRTWCRNCYENNNFIKPAYFEVYVLTCTHCLYNHKTPSYINI